MKAKLITGIIIIVLGIIAIAFSVYIKNEVEEGKKKIASAQSTVDTGTSLFNLSPATKPVGEMVTGSAQKKIDQGRRDVAKYEMISNWLMGIGIVLIIIGIIVVLTGFRKRKS